MHFNFPFNVISNIEVPCEFVNIERGTFNKLHIVGSTRRVSNIKLICYVSFPFVVPEQAEIERGFDLLFPTNIHKDICK